ncbi:MAG: C10 family peptidase [Muribaculum sp.]|nr:C10 family peptidase [Muribaculum sp.]
MKRNIFFICGLLILFAACQSNHDEEIKFEDFSNSVKELTGMERDIAIDILSSRYGGYKYGETPTRAAQDFSLSPYVVDGDTVFYIAQYANGWDIYSANHATSKVLFSSDEGVFDINDPSMPSQLRFLIDQNANEIVEISKDDISYVDPSWGGIAITDEIIGNAQTMVISIGGGYAPLPNTGTYPPGHWIIIETEELDSKTYSSPKLTKTEWGQEYPWNSYSKWVMQNNKLVQGPAGCFAVALAQYMYFTHYKDNVPSATVTSAIKTSDGKDYTFSGNSTSIWDSMSIREKDNLDTNVTALLIGYVGRQIKTDYHFDYASAKYSNAKTFLKDTYGVSFNESDFSITSVKESIDNGYPVIASARTNKATDGTNLKESGHFFLIDKYKTTSKTYKYTYALVRDDSQIVYPNPWMEDLKDSNGNIIKYAYTKEVVETQQLVNKFT